MSGTWKPWEGHIVDGKFLLRRYLGAADNQSAVFLTQSSGPAPEPAAIKLVLADSEGSELRLSRWERAAQLSHPHLIRLLHIGSCQLDQVRLLYVVMEYAEEDLAKVIIERPLTVVEVREMLEPVLNALAYIHGEGFVHGHLTPANVMAVSDQLKISSDGICKVGELAHGPRKPDVYDPPEFQVTGISPAADVWSLGMTLVQALTQRLPNQGGPTLESVLPETFPAVLRGIVADCLQPDPRQRSTVADIAARFRQTSSEPDGRSTASPHEASSRRRYLAPTATVGIALAATLAGTLLLRRPVPSRVPEQSSVQPKPEPKPVQAETEQSADRTTGAKESFAGSAPSLAPLRPEATPKPSGDSASGQVVHRVLPDVPQKARDTIRGKVTVGVRVGVDSSGQVVSAELVSAGPSRYFADLTVHAARHWEFRPPKARGHSVSSDWILRFELTRTATEVRVVRVPP